MSISTPFIKRPKGTTLLALLLAFAGIIAFHLLPVSQLPQVEFPTISVQASMPGASPTIMATAVATPLERQLGRIAHITEMTSTSSLGSTNVIIQFDLSRDIDGAARDVQAAINASLSQLPADLRTNPTYRKVNPADYPIMIIALTSSVYTKGQMYDLAYTYLQQKIAQLPGVGQVNVGGSSLPAVRVELNPLTLNKYGIGLDVVRNVLQSANANRPKGQLNIFNQTSDLVATDQIFHPQDYEPLLISYKNGNSVKLADVAKINNSVEDLRNAGFNNLEPSVLLIVYKQPDANVIETADQVRAILPQLQASIPAGIKMAVAMDRTTTIRASLFDVELTLLIAIFLVILVVYFSLGSFRATLIPSVTIPLSLLGTFAVMYCCNYSLDNLSLMALTISTGFVVDDAIVVLENITRYVESGMHAFEAAIKGAAEVNFTVVSMSISLIAVFIPILLMGGIVGRLFREFAVTLSTAILMSLLISLTVTPMMCARIIKVEHSANSKRKKLSIFDRLRHRYAYSLAWALRHSRLMLFLTFATIVLTIFLYIIVPKGFFPQQDTGRIGGSIVASQNFSFQAMKSLLRKYITIVKQDPAIANIAAFVGNGGSTNTGSMFITLKPLETRKVSADEIIARLRKALAPITGANLFLQSSQDLMIGGRQGNAQFQYTLSADNLEDLNYWLPKVIAKVSQLPGIADVNSDQRNNGLQIMIDIDHDTASRLGITTQQIDNTLYDAFGQRQVSTMFTTLNQYHVVMEVAPQYWQNPKTLNDIYVVSSSGKEVPLSAFARFNAKSSLLSVNHQNQFPSTTLFFNLIPGYALGDAVDNVTESIAELHLPPTIYGSFQGTAKAFQSSLASEPYLILAALAAVYIVLGILYESTIHPITILSTLPSAGVGAILALILTKTDLSVIAMIGIILLVGIVKKNAIMMIDFALQIERTENKSPNEAIYHAAVMRFRPIMMTTLAALLGALPLALGTGMGSELRQPLGIAIVGGLLVSQLLTLYTTPVMYLYLERVRKYINFAFQNAKLRKQQCS